MQTWASMIMLHTYIKLMAIVEIYHNMIHTDFYHAVIVSQVFFMPFKNHSRSSLWLLTKFAYIYYE